MTDNLFICYPDSSCRHLLGCWLRRQPASQRVVAMVPPSLAPEVAGVFRECGRENRELVPVAMDGALPEALARQIGTNDAPLVTVPLSLDHVPMRYQPSLMAELRPHYPLLTQLWAWGFRSVAFAGLRGAHTFPLPHSPEAFRGRHAGRRCFVVGNGPSLNNIDMKRLKDEITLGSNRCFLGYDTWGFPFTYWGVYDKYQIEQYHPEYEANLPSETTKFFPVEYMPVLEVENGCPLNIQWPSGVSRAFSAEPGVTYVGFTVTYMLLQVAALMGCDPIILIGTDHRYELSRRGYLRFLRSARRAMTRPLRGGRLYDAGLAAHRAWRQHGGGVVGDPALWSTEDAASATHFSAQYTGGGKNRFLPPEPEEAERDFDCAQDWANANGRQILNATPGTALESFPKVGFDTLF